MGLIVFRAPMATIGPLRPMLVHKMPREIPGLAPAHPRAVSAQTGCGPGLPSLPSSMAGEHGRGSSRSPLM